jgi:hypothetical protein
MADKIDDETIEKAVQAFDELDEWDAAIESQSGKNDKKAGGPATISGESTGTVVLGAPEVKKSKAPKPVKVQKDEPSEEDKKSDWPVSPKAKMIAAHYTREQAKELTKPAYDDFSDVVSNGAVSPARLAEYTSSIPFYYKSPVSDKEKMSWLPKYPKFLALFGVTDPSKITITEVFKKFDPKGYQDAMDADSESEKLARAGSLIIAQKGIDFNRELDESDYDILTRCGVKDPKKYKTVAQVTGIDNSIMQIDPDANVVYTKEYNDAMNETFGKPDGAPEPDVVSLDDIFGGLDPNLVRGFLGKKPGDIKAIEPDSEEGEEPSPAQAFVPFSTARREPPSLNDFAKAANRSKTSNNMPW